MSKKIDIIVANPAGNTTILVLTPTDRSEYQETTRELLDMDFGTYCDWADSVYGEQVAFILPDDGNLPAMEMCGLEFCGNASRSFAYYLASLDSRAKALHAGNSNDIPQEVEISVSGCNHPLVAKVNLEEQMAGIQMPLPTKFSKIDIENSNQVIDKRALSDALLVEMDGISHLVLRDIEATQERFEQLKHYIYPDPFDEPSAFGVMFVDTLKERMTPVVYVKDVNTIYFEGSCASGTTAASCALAMSGPDGEYDYSFVQPSGTLYTHVTKDSGEIKNVELTGHIDLSPVFSLYI